ncbi:hypothetical protein EDB89DRAFT_1839191, partial [Lactarius sanguifluus]
KRSRVQWGDSHTDQLIEWQEDNPEDHQKLFSDSSHDAKKENHLRHVAKGSKSAFYAKMAKYVFSADRDARVHVEVKEDIKKYSKAVENQVTHLKRRYHDLTQELGRMGTGLTVEEIQKDSNLNNVLGVLHISIMTDKLLADFPYWECFHGFWCTLPSFNPHTVLSEPSQDLEDEAIGVLFRNKDKAEGGASTSDRDEPN